VDKNRSIDVTKIVYQLPQPAGMISDIFVAAALDLDANGQEWVPQSADVSFRPLILNVSQGYNTNILRVRASGVLSRQRHSGPVHALTLRGRWRYLEHHWVASAGDYAFEPPGETHTLVVPEDVKEMVTLFHVTGGYKYVDRCGGGLRGRIHEARECKPPLRIPLAGAGLGAAVRAMKPAAIVVDGKDSLDESRIRKLQK
jgi:2,4'-dihydroxyacetophenone dioxygenase